LVFVKGKIVVEDKAYFDLDLMMQRIRAENIFVTRIKTNTVFKSIIEIELPERKDEDILKDEIIQLTSKKAIEKGISDI
jgi:hypothetical protein